MSSILVNQIGFLPHGVKEVTFRDSAIGATFRLVDDRTGGTVAEFLQSPPQDQINTGERCSRGNFSSFDRPGIYRITAGEETSCPFEIGEHVYDALIRDLTYMLHLQRCGQALTEEEAG
ncbi:MAG: glycoside hydrolase, partial [Lachnospiraceae bacterium]|nr:glycoside hydrolase [Lachnospiraceae bacterium]